MKTSLFSPVSYLCMLVLLALLPACDLLTPDECEEEPEKSCRISGIDTPWEEDTYYTYDSAGVLVKLQNGISLVEEVEAATIYLSYDANKKITEVWDDHDQKVVYVYENNRLVKTKHYYGPVLQFTRDYVRNSFGAIKEVLIHEGNGDKVFRKYTYTYDFRGNIAEARKYWTINDSLTLVSTDIYSEYDTKKNIEPWYFLPGTLKMKNNPGKITHISHIAGNSTAVDVLTYQYNSTGYPVSLQYKHGNEPAWNFAYQYSDCQ